jgi:dCTP deaminase
MEKNNNRFNMQELGIQEIRPGVLNKLQLVNLCNEDILEDVIDDFEEEGSDPSAFDLHLSKEGHELKGSIKSLYNTSVAEILPNKDICIQTIDLTEQKELKAKHTYLVQLKEKVRFTEFLAFHGRATGRSSVGRLDILTRLLVDKHPRYDEVPSNHSGPLYLEITPITFSVIVKEGVSLNQLRIFKGRPEQSELREEDLKLYGDMLFELDKFEKIRPIEIGRINNLRLSLEPVVINGQKVLLT